ncbi:putative C6 transcription factor [Aspergillus vadensis CBS 113365]|uniref:C6 zinc finger domain protein n=1 Tax=Aspergillus vadensis (strain CBS 113365 / IMI 142717 / IBT 24658) TaxID=1448311 RepID=A0A319BK98_ASPVC|nr:C6 zinc finger domain protein [Aspergillus vadensis CBS 113365]PYH63708.1 C6 zinc finger domain protein [Aspergillus vadensis CBS 113365]
MSHASHQKGASTSTFEQGTISPVPVNLPSMSVVPNADLDGCSTEKHLSRSENIANDPLIHSYYKNFHVCHPFVPPRYHLVELCQDPRIEHALTPLIAAMRFMGNIYSAREWSVPLKDTIETALAHLSPSDPIQVQCRILYSVALFWYDYKVDALSQLDQAAQIAIALQMFKGEFAASQEPVDLVLRESWRRTWWTLYIVDAYYAGTLGTMNFRVMDLDATVELPCDESDYELGIIPQPRTLEEFNQREFIPDDVHFSSFAHLIGAVQCAASAISITPKVATVEDSMHLIQAVDCGLDGWRLLLPTEQKNVIKANGDIDELLFQAHLLIHVSTVGLHRPLSALDFNAIEDVSSCARKPPRDPPTPDLVNVHTLRVLRAVEAQVRLLALPAPRFHHTPFTTCMVSEGILALLSACRIFFKGKDLAIARDQIRMALGSLKVLGEVWPRTVRNVGEIQTIARCVLGLEQGPNDQAIPGPSDPLSFGAHGVDPNLATDSLSERDKSPAASVFSIDDLCGWYNTGAANDFPWGLGAGL